MIDDLAYKRQILHNEKTLYVYKSIHHTLIEDLVYKIYPSYNKRRSCLQNLSIVQ